MSLLDGSLELLGAAAPALERGGDLLGGGIELLEARGVHVVLDLGVRERVAHLRELEGRVVDDLLRRALLTRKVRNLLVELAAARVQLIGCRGGLGKVVFGHLKGGTHLIELGLDALELLGHALALVLGAREMSAHIREPRHHVAALLLEQAHVGVDASHRVLHAAALLAEVAHKKALFLKHDLQLLEFALLLAHAVAR